MGVDWRHVLASSQEPPTAIALTESMIEAGELVAGDMLTPVSDLTAVDGKTLIFRAGVSYKVLDISSLGMTIASEEGPWLIEFPAHMQELLTKMRKIKNPHHERKTLSDFEIIPSKIFSLLVQYGPLQRRSIVSELEAEGIQSSAVKEALVYLQQQKYIQPDAKVIGLVDLTLKGRQAFKGVETEPDATEE
jgi:hypothetical protein